MISRLTHHTEFWRIISRDMGQAMAYCFLSASFFLLWLLSAQCGMMGSGFCFYALEALVCFFFEEQEGAGSMGDWTT